MSETENRKPLCIVTGGSLGIGYAVCQAFIEAGYRVLNLDVRDFHRPLNHATWMSCDVSQVAQVQTAIDDAPDPDGN